MYAILYAMRLRDKNYPVNQFKKDFLFKFLTFGARFSLEKRNIQLKQKSIWGLKYLNYF